MKHRTQLFLEQDQYREVARLAGIQSRTISDVVRELVDQGLEARERNVEERLQLLDDLAELGREIGPIAGDPLGEVREERQQELGRVLAGRESI